MLRAGVLEMNIDLNFFLPMGHGQSCSLTQEYIGCSRLVCPGKDEGPRQAGKQERPKALWSCIPSTNLWHPYNQPQPRESTGLLSVLLQALATCCSVSSGPASFLQTHIYL